MSAHGGTVECHCLMQVTRGAESCTLPCGEGIHNVLQQYRAQCSTSSKPVAEIPGTDGEYCTQACGLVTAMQTTLSVCVLCGDAAEALHRSETCAWCTRHACMVHKTCMHGA